MDTIEITRSSISYRTLFMNNVGKKLLGIGLTVRVAVF